MASINTAYRAKMIPEPDSRGEIKSLRVDLITPPPDPNLPNATVLCTPTKSCWKKKFSSHPLTPLPSPFPVNGYTHPWTPSTYNPWIPLPVLSGTNPKVLFGVPLPESPKSKEVRATVNNHYDDLNNSIDFYDYGVEMAIEDEDWQERIVGDIVDRHDTLLDILEHGDVEQAEFDYDVSEPVEFDYGDYGSCDDYSCDDGCDSDADMKEDYW